MAIQFEEIPAGESRQINGPIFGVRVLDVGEGAALEIDRVAIPVGVLVTLEHEIDRVVATGPILFARGESIDDDVTKASATPAKPHPAVLFEPEWLIGPGVTVPQVAPGLIERTYQRPSWARSAVVLVQSSVTPYGGTATTNVHLLAQRGAERSFLATGGVPSSGTTSPFTGEPYAAVAVLGARGFAGTSGSYIGGSPVCPDAFVVGLVCSTSISNTIAEGKRIAVVVGWSA